MDNPKNIIQNEIRQRKIYITYMWNLKYNTSESTYKTEIVNKHMVTKGERGEGINWNMELKDTTLHISPGISLEGMMLKLKLQYFGHLMQRVDSLEKTLMLGGIGDRRRRG